MMIFYYQFVKLGIFSIVFLFWDYRLRGSLMDDKHRGRPQRSFFRARSGPNDSKTWQSVAASVVEVRNVESKNRAADQQPLVTVLQFFSRDESMSRNSSLHF